MNQYRLSIVPHYWPILIKPVSREYRASIGRRNTGAVLNRSASNGNSYNSLILQLTREIHKCNSCSNWRPFEIEVFYKIPLFHSS